MDTVARTIRSIEIDDAGAARAANAIEDLYNDTLDVVVARQAFPRAPIATAGEANSVFAANFDSVGEIERVRQDTCILRHGSRQSRRTGTTIAR